MEALYLFKAFLLHSFINNKKLINFLWFIIRLREAINKYYNPKKAIAVKANRAFIK